MIYQNKRYGSQFKNMNTLREKIKRQTVFTRYIEG